MNFERARKVVTLENHELPDLHPEVLFDIYKQRVKEIIYRAVIDLVEFCENEREVLSVEEYIDMWVENNLKPVKDSLNFD